jgi:hypothetical protein
MSRSYISSPPLFLRRCGMGVLHSPNLFIKDILNVCDTKTAVEEELKVLHKFIYI